ncbi:hypothetical protein SDC9_146770 [bioreactor metagenome]|uniref:Uncharacterized protein n=1 Tax=bioreactor metagenome TaxID=1076179 RepID=A0A645EEM5_9ZZZZ
MAESGSIACFFHGSLCVKAARFLSFSPCGGERDIPYRRDDSKDHSVWLKGRIFYEEVFCSCAGPGHDRISCRLRRRLCPGGFRLRRGCRLLRVLRRRRGPLRRGGRGADGGHGVRLRALQLVPAGRLQRRRSYPGHQRIRQRLRCDDGQKALRGKRLGTGNCPAGVGVSGPSRSVRRRGRGDCGSVHDRRAGGAGGLCRPLSVRLHHLPDQGRQRLCKRQGHQRPCRRLLHQPAGHHLV